MKWTINYTNTAQQDLISIYKYIATAFCADDTAKNLVGQIMDEIASLDEMPNRYPKYDKKPWNDKGLRFFSVKNYLVFYLPNKETKTVFIIRIMYGGRDIEKQLS